MTWTAIVRQRGQITIPDSLRVMFPWLNVGSVVEIEDVGKHIAMRPLAQTSEKNIDWQRLKERMQLVRGFKGSRGNLSEFIANDRKQH